MIAERPSRTSRVVAVLLAAAVLVLASGCRTSGPSAPTGPPPTIRYMPVGDSITDGSGQGVPGAYRTALWQRLVQQDQLRIDFVGSRSGQGPPALGDQDHEGHGGWCIAGPCYDHDGKDIFMPLMTGWLRAARPDIVSIHLGTNDLGAGASGRVVANRLDQLVGLIYAENPDTYVVLIEIIPMYRAQQRITTQEDYDALIPGVAAKYQAQGRKVSVVDMSQLLTYPQDYRDGYHPTQAGYVEMAKALYPAISEAYHELA